MAQKVVGGGGRAETDAIELPPDQPATRGLPIDRLVCVVGPDLGRAFPLAGGPVELGRGDVDVALEASDVSRRHARLSSRGGAWVIEDLGSSNGTYVNGVATRGVVPVGIGDRIQLGSTILVLARHDELEERLVQLQKLEAMAQLVKGLAHDFNNVLMVIHAGLDELATAQLDANAREALGAVQQATHAAASLIRRLSQVGRKKPATSELIVIQDVVRDTVALAKHLAMEAIEITTDVEARLIRGSREELRNALLNIIINARDAMPRGGRIAIAGSRTTLDRTTALELHLAGEGHYFSLTVRDTGVGMSAATLARIFEPFFTTKQDGKGSGLGLAMVFSTIRSHGGAISVESVPNDGTTVRILLPIAD